VDTPLRSVSGSLLHLQREGRDRAVAPASLSYGLFLNWTENRVSFFVKFPQTALRVFTTGYWENMAPCTLTSMSVMTPGSSIHREVSHSFCEVLRLSSAESLYYGFISIVS
jgi:hypothetical protein